MSETTQEQVVTFGAWQSFQEGNYWQPLDGQVPTLRKAPLVRAAQDPLRMAVVTIDSYQAWVECDWQYPHGSPEMREHLPVHQEGTGEPGRHPSIFRLF